MYTEEWKVLCLQRFLKGENPFDPKRYPAWKVFDIVSKSFMLSVKSKNESPMSNGCYELLEKSKWTNFGRSNTKAYIIPLKHLTDRAGVQPEELSEIVKTNGLKLFPPGEIFSFFCYNRLKSSSVVFASELFNSMNSKFIVGQSSDGLYDIKNDIILSPNTDIVFLK